MHEEVLFRDRLEERFGERSREFSDHLIGMFCEFWTDGVEVGKWDRQFFGFSGEPPRPYEGPREIKILRCFSDNPARFSAQLKDLLVALWDDAVAFGKGEMCFYCGSTGAGIQMEPSRTMYEQKPDEPDPNADLACCRPCSQRHHEYWDEMWAEYRSSQGV